MTVTVNVYKRDVVTTIVNPALDLCKYLIAKLFLREPGSRHM